MMRRTGLGGLLGLALVACSPEVSVQDSPNVAPTVVIVSPDDGRVFDEADTVAFVASVADGDGLDDIGSVVWTSDLDGEIGTSTPDGSGSARLNTTLGAGSHTIEVTVTDREGERAVDAITVHVQGEVQNPSAVILQPQANGLYLSDVPLVLSGQVSDLQQAADSLQVAWSYEPSPSGGARTIVDTTPPSGGLAVGEWTNPIPGAWLIRLEVTDQDGNSNFDDLPIVVMHPDEADQDGDGYPGADDCDDLDFDVNPGRNEQCNGIDDDCSGVIDDKDGDGDGHVDEACTDYPGPLPVDDCNDTNGAIYLGAYELADNADNNCDGRVDEGTMLYDDDGDCLCEHLTICNGSDNPGCITLGGDDCDDADPAMNHDDADGDAASTCDGDCDDNDAGLNLTDFDNDSYTTCDGDCNDFDPLLTPATCP